MKNVLVSLILILSGSVIAETLLLDPTQVYNTGNLVTFSQNGSATTTPWQNVGQWNGSLTCWGPGGPGYCGPKPYVNSNGYGNINFSYGYTDLHQIVNIATALPNSGTGLRVNGFNFGFRAKNGNGWDNGQQDYLVAYVNIYDSTGKAVESYNYGSQTNRKYNWSDFYFSETFSTPYAGSGLSTARYGFVGYDTNYWAGPYGPEVTNVSFSLKYSVDPCSVNVLSSPTCPGYLDALAKLTPAQTNTTTSSPTSVIETQTSVQPTVTPTQISTPTNQTLTTPSILSTVATSSSFSSNNKNSSVNGTSIGLSVVAKNQQREQSIAMQAAQNAIAAADQSAQQTQQDALNVAQTSSNNSGTSNISSINSSKNSIGVLQQQNQTTNTQTQSIYSLLSPPAQSVQQTTIQQSTNITEQNNQYVLSNKQQVTVTTNDFSSSDSQKFLTDRSNPLYQALENKMIENQNNMTFQQGPVVNKNVQNNEIAGGVDLTRMALAPSGYNDYLNLVIRDVAFYAPKEVYKNQKNVDNARLMRNLSSDRLHQQMIDLQYQGR